MRGSRLNSPPRRQTARDRRAVADKCYGRFNLRASNTEPLLRLNAESRGDRALLDALDALDAQVVRLRGLIAG